MKTPVQPSLRLWSFDAVEFDEARFELRVAGEPVALQPLALNLLRCLLQAAPKVVPRDDLLARLWNRSDDHVSRNVLSNAARRVRIAIGDAGGERIVTVPGVGYRFAGDLTHHEAEAENTGRLLLPVAQDFLMRHWFDALHGRKGFDPRLSLFDVLRSAIDQAEVELAQSPLALAGLHQHLAEHDLLWSDHESAARHFRRAMALHVQAGQGPAADGMLCLHFDLCRTITLMAASCGDSQRMAHSRDELSRAQAALQHNRRPTTSTRLKAAMADCAMAGFELDWSRARLTSEAAIRLSESVPDLPTPQWLALHRNHGVTLARSGDLAAGIRKLQALVEAPERPLAIDDIQVLRTRLNLGQFQWLAGRHGEAMATLQALRDTLSGNAQALTTFGVDTDIWLGKACIDCGRAVDALALLRSAHERACTLKGRTSELALSAIVPLTRLMSDVDGQHEAALKLLREGIAPRLAQLARPGQREAVTALAHWIQTLWAAGQHAEALVLRGHLRLTDLRAVSLRPADADAFEAWLQAVDLQPAMVQGAAAKTSIKVC